MSVWQFQFNSRVHSRVSGIKYSNKSSNLHFMY